MRCFQRAARRLTSDGVFLIQAFVPNPARFDRGQRSWRVRFEVTQYDPSTQSIRSGMSSERERCSSVSSAATLRFTCRTRSDGTTRGDEAQRVKGFGKMR